jgi:hypothetical protein
MSWNNVPPPGAHAPFVDSESGRDRWEHVEHNRSIGADRDRVALEFPKVRQLADECIGDSEYDLD